MPRFLHTADWQIGRQYPRFDPDDAVPLAEARLTAVERIAALAAEESVDAVFAAGDVFDAQTVSDRTIRRLFNAMAGYTGPWILLPGNHDAALAESVWTRAQRLDAVPDNVHLALSAEPIEFSEQGFVVLPAPLAQRHAQNDLTAWFDQADTDSGLIRIGVAHGSVQGVLAEEMEAHNPIAPDRAETARLDYLALGDWHGAKQINARTWYSGTPEQERFRGNEPGHVLLVDIASSGATPAVMTHFVGQHQWIQHEAALAVSSDVDALVSALQELPEGAVVDLKIAGTVDLEGKQALDRAISVAKARFRSLTVDDAGLRLQPSEEDIASLKADGYVGAVIAELQEEQSGENGEVARDAMAVLAEILLDAQGQGGGA
ncbi:MAG: DNA repair exonuclease [Alcanivoracaceae bacterium]|nr:DNA repair exonuclease [Alcanivoracaceae bacterium]